MRDRIAWHRAERPREWLTVEEPLDVAETCRRLVPQLDLIVVDCLTVWVANLLDRGRADAAVLSDADALAALLGERDVSVIVVSNEVGEGVHPPTEIGLRFRDLLGAVNQRIAAAADLVTLMVAGIPVPIKRAAPGPPGNERGDRSHEAP
jgi:adenosylcobinamide kinase/adenosylcobinamide-phosphate guanylyltransferase